MYRLPHEYLYQGELLLQTNIFPTECVDKVRAFTLDEGDVVIASYPKSGTTWMQEIAYLVCNQVDVEKAKGAPLFVRSKFMEFYKPGHGPLIDTVEKDPRPRVLKTHIPARYLDRLINSPLGKIIVVMRNPKDALVSYYHYYRDNSYFGNFPGTWNDFFKMFEDKYLLYGDMFEWNCGWWAQKGKSKILFVTYEDMKNDIESVIRQVAQHCGKSLSTNEVKIIANNTTFQSMKDNPMSNVSLHPEVKEKVKNFMREGRVGGSSGYFSPDQNEFVDKLIQELYEPVGIKFSVANEPTVHTDEN